MGNELQGKTHQLKVVDKPIYQAPRVIIKRLILIGSRNL